MRRSAVLLLLSLVALPVLAAPEFNPYAGRIRSEPAVGRLLVKLRASDASRAQAQGSAGGEAAAVSAGRVDALGSRTGIALRHARSITGDLHVVELFRALEGEELAATLARLAADADVAYAAPDRRRFAHATPNDPLFSGTPGVAGQTGQWYMQAPQSTPAGPTTAAVNAVGAWDVTKGTNGVVIADLDTGVRFDHPDLLKAADGGKLLPGFDFVGPDGGPGGSGFMTANDGDGWDADPSDPGDWLTAADVKTTLFTGCTPDNSSWHGTRTAGILGALTNNSVGVAGFAWNSWILPVRVLGKCGGYDSDIISGMLWAAGIAVGGAPANPYPAKIINMSLGAPGACGGTSSSAPYPDTIRQVNARGTIVVVSAGNEGGPVDEPANCAGVIAVTGVRHVGTKVGFANLGPEVALAAPAGNCVNTAANSPCLFSIDTTINAGTTVPTTNGYTDQTSYNVGTSFSAPIVAGITALMLSVNGNLTPAQIATRLRAGTNAFPKLATDTSGAPIPMCYAPAAGDTTQTIECNCTTGTCGAGLADAQKAVAQALRPIAAVTRPGTTAAGQTVSLDASVSAAACGRTVAGYAWSVTSPATGAPALSALTGPTTSLAAPASGTVTVQLVVTDDQGHADTTTLAVAPTSVTSAAPTAAGGTACLPAVALAAPATQPPTGGGKGGGGAVDTLTLVAGALLGAVARRRRIVGPVRS